jgi:hypothetical protein
LLIYCFVILVHQIWNLYLDFPLCKSRVWVSLNPDAVFSLLWLYNFSNFTMLKFGNIYITHKHNCPLCCLYFDSSCWKCMLWIKAFACLQPSCKLR